MWFVTCLLTKLLLHFLLRNVLLLPDDCSSSMGVLKVFWWSVQMWVIATGISEKTTINRKAVFSGRGKGKTSHMLATSPQTRVCQNRLHCSAFENCFCPCPLPPQSSCFRESPHTSIVLLSNAENHCGWWNIFPTPECSNFSPCLHRAPVQRLSSLCALKQIICVSFYTFLALNCHTHNSQFSSANNNFLLG